MVVRAGLPGGSVMKNPLMKETQVQPVVQEDPTFGGTTKSVCHNY